MEHQMAYATLEDLRVAFGEREVAQLTQRRTDFVEAADAATSVSFLEQASSEIDSRLATRYDVPVSPAPRMLVAVCCDIARYRLYDDAAPETVRTRYEDAVRWLNDLAAGRAALLNDDGSVAGARTTDTGAASAVVAVPRALVFGAGFRTRYDSELAP
jgi:phage gp36-like protein